METQVPGLGVAVSVDGSRVVAYAGQPALGQKHTFSDHSRFEMSCLMKLLSSLTVLELNWEGVLDIEQPVQEYVPEFAHSGDVREKLRVRHLMSHTGGYRGVDISHSQTRWNYSWERFLKHLEMQEQHFAPGSVFNYEHTEHVILGEIMRRACGRPPLAIVQERILDPLNIQLSCAKSDQEQGKSYVAQHAHTTTRRGFAPVSLPGFGSFWAASLPDTTLTLQDILTVGEAILEDPNSEMACEVFSKRTRMALTVSGPTLPRQVASDIRSEQVPLSFGLGFGHYRGGLLGHNGSMFGQTCTLRVDPSQKVAIAVGVNAWVPYARDIAVSRTWASIMGADEASEHSEAVAEGSPFKLEQLMNGFTPREVAGRYLGSYFGEIHVSGTDEAIHFDLGPEGPKRARISAVQTAPAGEYAIESPVPVLAGFFKDPDGRGEPALMMGVHAYKKSACHER